MNDKSLGKPRPLWRVILLKRIFFIYRTQMHTDVHRWMQIDFPLTTEW
jgi:hypothetical protein